MRKVCLIFFAMQFLIILVVMLIGTHTFAIGGVERIDGMALTQGDNDFMGRVFFMLGFVDCLSIVGVVVFSIEGRRTKQYENKTNN